MGSRSIVFLSPVAARWRTVAAASYGTASILAFALLPDRVEQRSPPSLSSRSCDLVFPHTRVERSRLAARSIGNAVATLNGDLVTIYGVRNFDYRSAKDFTPRWEERTYDLRKLDSADIIAVYWAGKAIAHIMVSFGFQGKDYLAVSIEMRKAKGQELLNPRRTFPAIRALLRRRRRARRDPCPHNVSRAAGRRLYLPHAPPQRNIRRVFLDYIQKINDIDVHPRFYNTLTTNCTTRSPVGVFGGVFSGARCTVCGPNAMVGSAGPPGRQRLLLVRRTAWPRRACRAGARRRCRGRLLLEVDGPEVRREDEPAQQRPVVQQPVLVDDRDRHELLVERLRLHRLGEHLGCAGRAGATRTW